MVKKIVLLSVAAVLFIAVCVTGIKPSGVYYGSGSGADAALDSREALAELLLSVRTSEELMNSAAAGNEGGHRSFSMREVGGLRIKTNRSTQISSLRYRSESSETRLSRTMEAYYAEDAAYYHAVGTYLTMTESVVEVFSENPDTADDPATVTSTAVSRAHDSTEQSFDIELYLLADKIYIKYNLLDTQIQQYTETYDESGNAVREDVEDDAAQIGKIAVECVQSHYGKWIDLSYEAPAFDPDTAAGDEKELMLGMMVGELADLLCSSFTLQNDGNVAYLTILGGFLQSLPDEDFPQGETLYQLSDAAADAYFSSIGYGGNDTGSQSLSVGLMNPARPVVYQSALRMHNAGNATQEQSFFSKSIFYNIDNTVVSFRDRNVIGAYDLFAPMLEQIMNEWMGGESA